MARDRSGDGRRLALLEARSCIDEIAANYSHAFVTFASLLLTRLWNRLYDGVDLTHVERTLQQVADGNELVYVPCHRSHMDYLLLSYRSTAAATRCTRGAGVNLNLPVVGRYLRKAADFHAPELSRQLALHRGLMQYLAAIMARGHAIEYFIEGGRSRSGRLLAPMTGMLSMTRAQLPAPAAPSGGLRAGVFRLRAHLGGRHLHQ